MKNTTLVTCFIIFSLYFIGIRGELTGQTVKSVVEKEWITLKNEDREIKCLIAYPVDKDKATGVIIIHEEWGMTDWIRSFAEQMVAEGYLIAAPDLLSGITPQKSGTADFINEDEARHFLLNADPYQITSELDAVYSYLATNSSCNGKIVLLGFAWGGNQAFKYMTQNPDITAGFIFYGVSPKNKKELGRIRAPVYGFYGEYDSRVNMTLWDTDRKMKKLGKKYEPIVFESGGHGFMRSGERLDTNEGNIKAKTAAWKKLIELLSVI